MDVRYPHRIVCLTEEPTEVLYALGEEERIVGVSKFTVRPPRAREDKPRISGFTAADVPAILELEPDLVIGFSDVQAKIANDLVAAGLEVWIANHRSIAGILSYVRRLGAMVGAADRAAAYAGELERHVEEVRDHAGSLPRRPRVWFEEWDRPLITGSLWVSELIGIAGGVDTFAERAASALARGRIIEDPDAVVRRRPDVILASWCGKRFRRGVVTGRPGWKTIPAVAGDQIHEIDASIILQPGPAALTDGLDTLHRIIAKWATEHAVSESG